MAPSPAAAPPSSRRPCSGPTSSSIVARPTPSGSRAAAELRATEVALEARLGLDRQTLVKAETDERRVEEDWAALWASSAFEPGAPAGTAAWLTAKDEALRSLAAAREASGRAERASALALRARALGARAAALLGVPPDGAPGEDPHARMVHLRSALADRRDLWSRALAAGTAVTRCASKRDEAERALEELARADAARSDDWSALAARFGWRSAATVAEAEAVLRNWEGLAAPLSDMETALRRLVELREDNRSFRTRVAEVASILVRISGEAAEGAAGTPEMIVRRLEDGLATEMAALARHREARLTAEASGEELEVARTALATAEAAVAGFRRLHGLAPGADCVSVGQRGAEARHLRAAIARRRVDLIDAGEGLGEPALREEAASMPSEFIAAEVAALGGREEALVEAGQLAAQDWSSADAASAQVSAKVGGVDARGRERAATLAFEGYVERWLLLAAAQGILSQAIERYRAANQHPMVARAGQLMAELTRGHPNPIERLSAEYRDGRRLTLLGIRRDDSPCEIANMTEGTRDQLFLALRIAAIERYALAREPLPFVADDLFITSDDDRTERGLHALGRPREDDAGGPVHAPPQRLALGRAPRGEPWGDDPPAARPTHAGASVSPGSVLGLLRVTIKRSKARSRAARSPSAATSASGLRPKVSGSWTGVGHRTASTATSDRVNPSRPTHENELPGVLTRLLDDDERRRSFPGRTCTKASHLPPHVTRDGGQSRPTVRVL